MTDDLSDGVLKPQLWVERPVAETVKVYTDWAASYEAEVTARGYHTPRRIAEALAVVMATDERPILDFGCGTGLGGLALRAQGFGPIHGTDITAAMIDEARPRGIYDHLWLSEPSALGVDAGTYKAIVAAGVVSLGAAPPETMDTLITALAPGDLLAMSFNDPTLAHGGYDAHLAAHIGAGHVTEVFREHGPHLDDVGMKSDVMVLKRL